MQGLADVFAKLNYAFDSNEAKQLNIDIFETIYYGAVECSMEISKRRDPLMRRYIELLNRKNNLTGNDFKQDFMEKVHEMGRVQFILGQTLKINFMCF